MKIAVTGATGLVGSHVVASLRRSGLEPVAFTRRPERPVQDAVATRLYSIEEPMDFSDCTGVIHLAGESVLGRWTEAKKERIRESRIQGTRAVVDSLLQTADPRSFLIAASGIGIYGDRGDAMLSENDPPGDDFLAQVAVDWEKEASRAREGKVRTAMARIGFVLARDGGGWPMIARIFKLGLGGRLGSGDQWMSWVHVDDLADALVFAARTEGFEGPFHAVAPQPVTNREFTRIAAKVLGRPALLPVPGMGMRLLAGEMASVALESQRATPRRLMEKGFSFTYPGLQTALENLKR